MHLVNPSGSALGAFDTLATFHNLSMRAQAAVLITVPGYQALGTFLARCALATLADEPPSAYLAAVGHGIAEEAGLADATVTVGIDEMIQRTRLTTWHTLHGTRSIRDMASSAFHAGVHTGASVLTGWTLSAQGERTGTVRGHGAVRTWLAEGRAERKILTAAAAAVGRTSVRATRFTRFARSGPDNACNRAQGARVACLVDGGSTVSVARARFTAGSVGPWAGARAARMALGGGVLRRGALGAWHTGGGGGLGREGARVARAAQEGRDDAGARLEGAGGAGCACQVRGERRLFVAVSARRAFLAFAGAADLAAWAGGCRGSGRGHGQRQR